MVGLRLCARASSSCGKRGPLLIAVRGPLSIAASLAAEHRLQTRRLSSCGSRAQLLRGMWDPPRPGLEPASPASAGGLPTTAPSGKPDESLSYLELFTRSLAQRLTKDLQHIFGESNSWLITNADVLMLSKLQLYQCMKSRSQVGRFLNPLLIWLSHLLKCVQLLLGPRRVKMLKGGSLKVTKLEEHIWKFVCVLICITCSPCQVSLACLSGVVLTSTLNKCLTNRFSSVVNWLATLSLAFKGHRMEPNRDPSASS